MSTVQTAASVFVFDEHSRLYCVRPKQPEPVDQPSTGRVQSSAHCDDWRPYDRWYIDHTWQTLVVVTERDCRVLAALI